MSLFVDLATLGQGKNAELCRQCVCWESLAGALKTPQC